MSSFSGFTVFAECLSILFTFGENNKKNKQTNREKAKSVCLPDYLLMDFFGDTAIILNSFVSKKYSGMLSGQISSYLPLRIP